LIDADSENGDTYKQYHLDDLIGHEKISITKQPLLFFLGFIDALEPRRSTNPCRARTIQPLP
jgi:hypothetical protein